MLSQGEDQTKFYKNNIVIIINEIGIKFKMSDDFKARVILIGNSQGLIIPKERAKGFYCDIQIGDKLTLSIDRNDRTERRHFQDKVKNQEKLREVLSGL